MQTRGVRNALPNSHTRGNAKRKAEKRAHLQSPLDENKITEVVKQQLLRWFGHVTIRPNESYVAKAYREDFSNPRPRGRPPKKWISCVREDIGLPIATAERRASGRSDWRTVSRLERARGRRVLNI